MSFVCTNIAASAVEDACFEKMRVSNEQLKGANRCLPDLFEVMLDKLDLLAQEDREWGLLPWGDPAISNFPIEADRCWRSSIAIAEDIVSRFYGDPECDLRLCRSAMNVGAALRASNAGAVRMAVLKLRSEAERTGPLARNGKNFILLKRCHTAMADLAGVWASEGSG